MLISQFDPSNSKLAFLVISVLVCSSVTSVCSFLIENYRLQSTYDNNLILKTVFVS